MRLLRLAHFTLLEMLLVFALVLMTAGVIGYHVRQAYQKSKFDGEVSTVVNQLRLAQDLMIVLDGDIHLKFKAQSDGIEYWMESEKELPNEWAYLMKPKDPKKPNKRLKTIRLVGLDPSQESAELDLCFLSGGTHMSKGLLTLSNDSNPQSDTALKRYIHLSGSPQPIVDVKDPPQKESAAKLDDPADRLTKIMQDEIRSRQ